MIVAELPEDEELRLLDLASYNIMDTAAEADFDGLVELASQICKCPISVISLLDHDRQWFKAKKGIADAETPRDIAFCAHTILSPDIMIVPDATKDKRFIDNPLVTGDLNCRFYAGAPIVSPEGFNLGTICIIDTKPKTLSADEERALLLLSKQVTKLLEIKKKNILITQRAEEMLALKSNAISHALKNSETDKQLIAESLHEGLAQEIASSILYLEMSLQTNDGNSLVETAKEQLQTSLTKMRNLSYSITPHTLNWLPAEELVKEFVESISVTCSFKINVSVSGKKKPQQPGISLTSIRIIEGWFKILAAQSVKHVNVIIEPLHPFQLSIEDDGPVGSPEARKDDAFTSLVYERARCQNGTVETTLSDNGMNLLIVTLPFLKEEIDVQPML